VTKDTIIGTDLAKSIFQLHAVSMAGELKFRKKLSRQSFSRFMAEQPPALVVMEACGSAHYWAREMIRLGHEVKLQSRPDSNSRWRKNSVVGQDHLIGAGQYQQPCSILEFSHFKTLGKLPSGNFNNTPAGLIRFTKCCSVFPP
jgi:hypothetical protein